MRIVVLPGDGIGPEISDVTVDILNSVSRHFNLQLDLVSDVAGVDSLQKYGATVTTDLLRLVKESDGLVLGPMATYEFKDESKGEINPSKFFRKSLDLYANIRPARTYEGNYPRRKNFDLVVVRENTEGFYADRNIVTGSSELLITPKTAISLRRITYECCERIALIAFELAMRRNKHVTIVHKANVLKITDGMFVECCRSISKKFPDVSVDEVIVDAMMAHVLREPQRFDVIVTTNMFGDILSDLTAELSGSLGLGGSLNVGVHYAMAQAAHGSAPDIAGKNLANPFSLVTSVAMLLEWYANKRGCVSFHSASSAIFGAMADCIKYKECTPDIGGNLGTKEVGKKLLGRLENHLIN